ncbi:hypothetical protein OAS35_02690 [Pelagibacteraceae bacterium]|nr:hypothetical protein [Pelagibacteraceae bacterium]
MIEIRMEKKEKKISKIIYKIFFIMLFSTTVYSNEIKCNSPLSKLKPECNFIGKGAKKLKSISENNKTINQSLENLGVVEKKDPKKKITLKELNEKYKREDTQKPVNFKELNEKYKREDTQKPVKFDDIKLKNKKK